MFWKFSLACLSFFAIPCLSINAGEITGNYMEARTCQVYTGPCFANGEVGQTGKDAVMAWAIEQGSMDSVDLSGLGIALVVRSTDTLGFHGLKDARTLRAVAIVDSAASPRQQQALLDFVTRQTNVQLESIKSADVDMQLDILKLEGNLRVGNQVAIQARKARPEDCICSNESAYYPPLTELKGFVPGVTIVGDVRAPSLGTRWSIPDSRTAYLGTFVTPDPATPDPATIEKAVTSKTKDTSLAASQ